MTFNEFQYMMQDFRTMRDKGYSPERISICLIRDYLWDYNQNSPLCDMGKVTQAVRNTLRC